jgi:hypothetical protein
LFDNQIGKFDLADGKLTVELAEHCSDEQSARHIVEQYLRTWEIETDLTGQIGQIRFTFLNSKIIDRDPPPPGGSRIVQAKTASLRITGHKASIHITCGKYPDPPTAFATTPDVELVHNRWTRFREGKEPLQAMAYFLFTVIEKISGNPKQAASDFQVELAVLKKISELSSTKGDANTARKADFVEMSGSENAWLEAAVRKIILRLGERASGKPLDKITFADFPQLPH